MISFDKGLPDAISGSYSWFLDLAAKDPNEDPRAPEKILLILLSISDKICCSYFFFRSSSALFWANYKV